MTCARGSWTMHVSFKDARGSGVGGGGEVGEHACRQARARMRVCARPPEGAPTPARV